MIIFKICFFSKPSFQFITSKILSASCTSLGDSCLTSTRYILPSKFQFKWMENETRFIRRASCLALSFSGTYVLSAICLVNVSRTGRNHVFAKVCLARNGSVSIFDSSVTAWGKWLVFATWEFYQVCFQTFDEVLKRKAQTRLPQRKRVSKHSATFSIECLHWEFNTAVVCHDKVQQKVETVLRTFR